MPHIEPLEQRQLLTNLPAGFDDTVIASGLEQPTAMEFAPDSRLFVAQQTGDLRVIKNDQLLSKPFVSLNVDSNGERGLLGVAFDPNFASNHFVYVYYTVNSAHPHNRVSRFTADGDVAQADSEKIILDLNNLSDATNHNGGAIHLGPDGKLYIAAGDNAHGANSQSLKTLLGKILRINPDGSIPADNPFFNETSGKNRAIWALGLRNPFTFSFQNATGRMFINDVGQNTFEEIDDGIVGSNYGWPDTEGPTNDNRFRAPLYFYTHDSGACAITGGAFYNPTTTEFPSTYVGKYFFADYCGGFIKQFNPATKKASGFATGLQSVVDVETGPDGNLYYIDRRSEADDGVVGRISFVQAGLPQISTPPANVTAGVGEAASFSVAVEGVGPFTYQWQRNGQNIQDATSSTFTIPAAAFSDDGDAFRVRVSNDVGSTFSSSATLTVTGNHPPTAKITSPAKGKKYKGGDRFTFSGTASDPEDGTLGAASMTWQVVFHHNQHTHPFFGPVAGVSSGSFTIPTEGETSANVFYRVMLTVRDSGGATKTSFVDILPRKSKITLATNIAGLKLDLDSQPLAVPTTIIGVVGIERTLEAPLTEVLGGKRYKFVDWSDGGDRSHTISTPTHDMIYTAMYKLVRGP